MLYRSRGMTSVGDSTRCGGDVRDGANLRSPDSIKTNSLAPACVKLTWVWPPARAPLCGGGRLPAGRCGKRDVGGQQVSDDGRLQQEGAGLFLVAPVADG